MTLLSCGNVSKEKNISIFRTKTEKADSLKIPKVSMTNSSSLEPSKDIILDRINFSIVQNKKGDTTFLATRDVNFKTPEGYSVGNQFKDISQLEKNRIYKDPGYGYLIELNSGWQLGFCEGNSCTDNIPTENSIIKWIQKQK